MSNLRLLSLRRDDPEAWALMPQALARIQLFCGKWDQDSTPDVLAQAVMQHFVADEPLVLVLVAIVEGEIVGHGLVSLDTWCGKRVATVFQFQTDRALPTAFLRDAMDQLAAWATRRGAVAVRLQAYAQDGRGPARMRAFRRWGFRVKTVVMERQGGEG